MGENSLTQSPDLSVPEDFGNAGQAGISPLWAPLILLLVLPLGVAGQNIGTGIVAFLLLLKLSNRNVRDKLATAIIREKVSVCLAAGFVVSLAMSTLMNPSNSDASALGFIASHVSWLFLPCLVAIAGPFTRRTFLAIETVLLIIAGVFGVLALTQRLVGWQVVGSHFVIGAERARGFYSHPLTFAYVVLLLWPYCVLRLLRSPQSVLSWVGLVGTATALVLSESRTVLAVAAIIFFYNVLVISRRHLRLLLLALAATGGIGILFTPNPLSEKIKATYSEGGFDRNTQYSDDRVAFWVVHLNMAKDRPVFGHGVDLSPTYLTPYYAAIGLGEFSKKYPAHNTFLQVLVNGGLVGLALFASWWCSILVPSFRLRHQWGHQIFCQTLIALGLASLTQNSFQDSEVRYALTLAIAAIWQLKSADVSITSVIRE